MRPGNAHRSHAPSQPRRACAALLAVVMVLAGIGAANADVVSNDLDNSVDSAVESLNLTAGGAAGTVNLAVDPRNGDGKNGCNFTGSTYADFSVTSSNPAVATVSPSSVRFTSCSDVPTLTVAPVAAGTVTVTLAQTANTTGGSFDVRPAAFTVDVAPPAAPACEAAPAAAPAVVASNGPDAATGWYNSSSLAAAFTLDPAANAEYSLDGGATWHAYAGEVVLGGDGTHSVTARSFRPATGGCARQDGPASPSPSVFRVDRSAPVLEVAATPAANAAGWNSTPVTVAWTCSDTGGSGLAAGACPAGTEHGNGTHLPAADVTVSDVAGNTSRPATRRAVKVDTVAPVLSAGLPAANRAGWNNTLVTVNWTCTDDNSGFATPSPCPSDESFGEADSPVAERTVSVADLAGNAASFTRRSIRIDVTEPSAAVVVSPDAVEGWNRGRVDASYSCDGGTSPLDPATPCPVDEAFIAEGSYPARTFTVHDAAGNASPVVTRRAVRIDTTPPVVTVTLRNADGEAVEPNANGWFSRAVTVDFSCSDPVSGGVASGVASTGRACPSDYTVSTDGIHDEVGFEVADTAGNVAAGTVPTIRIDTVVPTLGVDVGPPANAAGWNRTTGHVDWTCSDGPGGSGVDLTTCPADTSHGNGTDLPAAEHSVVDLAGNRSPAVQRRAVRVDTVAPTLTLSMSAAANDAGWNNVRVSADWTCEDDAGAPASWGRPARPTPPTETARTSPPPGTPWRTR